MASSRSSAVIQAEIDALRASISTGILRVRHGDTETTYQDASTMRQVLRELEAELAGTRSTRIRSIRFKTTKGL